MIHGWMSSYLIDRRRGRAFDALARSRHEVLASGRAASAGHRPASFFTDPHDVPALSSFPNGVAEALRSHLDAQGLSCLAGHIPELHSIGQRLGRRPRTKETVSDLVYEMH
jgi:hypothetical protein